MTQCSFKEAKTNNDYMEENYDENKPFFIFIFFFMFFFPFIFVFIIFYS